MPSSVSDRFALKFDPERHRRTIGGAEVIIHCHHYNARFQAALENSTAVDGKAIIVDSAEAVFARHLRGVVHEGDEPAVRWRVASDLYSHLGYGRLDFSQVAQGVVTAAESHFVEGGRAILGSRKTTICSLAQGYIQGASAVVTGRPARVREVECMILGAPICRFELDSSRTEPLTEYVYNRGSESAGRITIPTLDSPNIDEARIIGALVAMPIAGNNQGLIPAFNVYLANTPGDFYNLVTIRYVEEMERSHMGDIARELLVECSESCAMSTFRGILESAEWDALIRPMVKEPADKLFGLVAVSKALGWGDWRVLKHAPAETLQMVSYNGYESVGYLAMRGPGTRPACFMLTGVTAGIMELLYGYGSMNERLGQFSGTEPSCRSAGAPCCEFQAEADQ